MSGPTNGRGPVGGQPHTYRAFEATWPARCGRCPEPINPGDLIIRDPELLTVWVHVHCSTGVPSVPMRTTWDEPLHIAEAVIEAAQQREWDLETGRRLLRYLDDARAAADPESAHRGYLAARAALNARRAQRAPVNRMRRPPEPAERLLPQAPPEPEQHQAD